MKKYYKWMQLTDEGRLIEPEDNPGWWQSQIFGYAGNRFDTSQGAEAYLGEAIRRRMEDNKKHGGYAGVGLPWSSLALVTLYDLT